MDARIDDGLWQPRLAAALSSAFGALTLALAAVGVFGVVTFATAQRRAELSVRAALGASPPRLARLVLRDAAALAGVGIALGVALSLVVARPLGRVLAGGGGVDPLPLLGSGVVILVAVVAAAYLPARRAARTNPRDTLG
jgi:ABC-type antimicrobial peptide transport system permease subunit